MPKLRTNTYVTNPRSGENEILKAGTEPPDWAEDLLDPGVFEEEPAHTTDYHKFTVHELVEKVKERGLDVESTKKADLVEALEADDAN